jgi:hypothetical protein
MEAYKPVYLRWTRKVDLHQQRGSDTAGSESSGNAAQDRSKAALRSADVKTG